MHLSRFFNCRILEDKGFVIITSGFCLDFYKNLEDIILYRDTLTPQTLQNRKFRKRNVSQI